MQHKLFKVSICISLLLLLLEVYRWYLWNIDPDSWTVWRFLIDKKHTGLLWNLLLAWISVILAWFVLKSKHRILTKFLSLVWVLWLPNTLYMVTDLKYFRSDGGTSIFHEIIFFTLFGIVGVLLYILSVYLVFLKYRFSKRWLGIITVLAIIGVIIGRVLRWNSWDIFTNPEKILTYFLNLF